MNDCKNQNYKNDKTTKKYHQTKKIQPYQRQ